MLSQNAILVVFKPIRDFIPSSTKYERIYFKQFFIPSDNSFQAVVKITREIIPTTRYQQKLHYKQYIRLSEYSFLIVRTAISYDRYALN